MEIQLSHLQAVRFLVCDITDFLFFPSTLLTLSVFVLPRCYSTTLWPNEMSFPSSCAEGGLSSTYHSVVLLYLSLLLPPPVFFTAESFLKMSRGLTTLTLLHEPVSLKPIPSQLRSLRLCHSSFTRKREAPSTLTWSNTDCTSVLFALSCTPAVLLCLNRLT